MQEMRFRSLSLLPALAVIGLFSTASWAIDGAQSETPETDQLAESKLLTSDGDQGDEFGVTVAISGETLVAGASHEDEAGEDAGAVYIFQGGERWLEIAKLTASDGEADDHFGTAVAISDDIAVVGADLDDDAGDDSGSAYVFTRTNGAWGRVEIAKLTASEGVEGDRFGGAVAVGADVIVAGASFHSGPAERAGAAYVFERRGEGWEEAATLTASDAGANDRLGLSVAVSGETVVVGAPLAGRGGAAYVFESSGDGAWEQTAKLTPTEGALGDFFGGSVAIGGDTVVVGASGRTLEAGAPGAAYVFRRDAGTWTEAAELTASDAASEDLFGNSVAISGDLIVVGSYGNDAAGAESGAAYVFQATDEGWEEIRKITASDGASDDVFAFSVSISDDTAAIGAHRDDDNGRNSGSVYAYRGVGAAEAR